MATEKSKTPLEMTKEGFEEVGKAFGKVGINMDDVIKSSADMRKITAEEFEERVGSGEFSHRQRKEYGESSFTFKDLVIVFLGSQVITAVIVWATIIITRVKL